MRTISERVRLRGIGELVKRLRTTVAHANHWRSVCNQCGAELVMTDELMEQLRMKLVTVRLGTCPTCGAPEQLCVQPVQAAELRQDPFAILEQAMAIVRKAEARLDDSATATR